MVKEELHIKQREIPDSSSDQFELLPDNSEVPSRISFAFNMWIYPLPYNVQLQSARLVDEKTEEIISEASFKIYANNNTWLLQEHPFSLSNTSGPSEYFGEPLLPLDGQTIVRDRNTLGQTELILTMPLETYLAHKDSLQVQISYEYFRLFRSCLISKTATAGFRDIVGNAIESEILYEKKRGYSDILPSLETAEEMKTFGEKQAAIDEEAVRRVKEKYWFYY